MIRQSNFEEIYLDENSLNDLEQVEDYIKQEQKFPIQYLLALHNFQPLIPTP